MIVLAPDPIRWMAHIGILQQHSTQGMVMDEFKIILCQIETIVVEPLELDGGALVL